MSTLITTRYGSNANGAGRIYARSSDHKATRSVPYDHSCSVEQNHIMAANALLRVISPVYGGNLVAMIDDNVTHRTWRVVNDTYAQREVDHAISGGPDDESGDVYRLKVIGKSAGTKWLSITPAQLAAIREILGYEY